MQNTILTLIIMAVMIVLFIAEIFPPAFVMLGASVMMAIAGIVDFNTAFSGFSDDIIMLNVGIAVMTHALFKSGSAVIIGNFLRKNFARNEKFFLVTMVAVTAVLSIFMPNTATAAIMIPVILSVFADSNGQIDKRVVLMPMAMASLVGGTGSLIGSTPQMVAQSVLESNGLPVMEVFDLAYVGVPLILVLLLYFGTVGHTYTRWCLRSSPEKKADIESLHAIKKKTTEEQDMTLLNRTPDMKRNQIISLIVLICTITCYILQLWSFGAISVCAIIVLLITGCVTEKEVYQATNWGSIFLIAGSLGFAKGVSASGVLDFLVEKFVALIGASSPAFVYFALLVFIAIVFTNVAANTAVAAMLYPIGIAVAQMKGASPVPFIIGIAVGASLACTTPVGVASMTLVYEEGRYTFRDYLKVGAPINLILYLIVILIVPLVWKF